MIVKTINELNKIFKLLNKLYFEDKLETPVILIQAKAKKNTLGTCSCFPIWENKKQTEKKYEITMSGEYLNRTIEEIVCTLLHEMVHLYCSLNEIKDTSNKCVYHIKQFKKEAELRGLIIEKAKTIGWSVSTLQEPTKEIAKSLYVDDTAFDYWRNTVEFDKIKKPKVVTNKYYCPSCETKISSLKELNIICGTCDVKFEIKE